MENLSELDDCINTLEQLQLTLDIETPTVKRNPKASNFIDPPDFQNISVQNKRIDLVQSHQNFSNKSVYLPDVTKSTMSYRTDISPSLSRSDQKRSMLNSDVTDFKSVSVRQQVPYSSISSDNELLSVPESEMSDFPPPPPSPVPADGNNYLTSMSTPSHVPYSPLSVNCNATGPRKSSMSSLKLSPKPISEPRTPPPCSSPTSNGSHKSSLSYNVEKETLSPKPMVQSDTISVKNDGSQQTVVRFFSADKTTKALVVNENMTICDTIKMLMEKNFWNSSLKSAIVEKVPGLKMERFFEEHEYLLSCINSWPSTCANMIFFEERDDVYGMFENSKVYLGDNYPNGAMNVESVKNLYLSISTNLHEFQDYLYIRKPGDNTWKRKFCLLNQHGIYVISKKKSKSSKQTNVMAFNESYYLYTTTGGWTKEYCAPTPFGFAFKPFSVVDPKSTNILMFCSSDEVSMKRWCSNLRLCKYKIQIVNNYEAMRNRSMISSSNFSSENQISRTMSLAPTMDYRFPNYNSLSRSSLPNSALLFNKNQSHKFKF